MVTYSQNKSIIINDVRYDNRFMANILNKDMKRMKKNEIDLIPGYSFKFLKIKFMANYTRLDPNQHVDLMDYLTPLNGGIILMKLRFIIL